MHCVVLAVLLVIMEIYVPHNAQQDVSIARLLLPAFLVNPIVTEHCALCSAVVTARCQPMEEEYVTHQLESVFLVAWMGSMVIIAIGSVLQIVVISHATETRACAMGYVKRVFMGHFAMNLAVGVKL